MTLSTVMAFVILSGLLMFCATAGPLAIVAVANVRAAVLAVTANVLRVFVDPPWG